MCAYYSRQRYCHDHDTFTINFVWDALYLCMPLARRPRANGWFGQICTAWEAAAAPSHRKKTGWNKNGHHKMRGRPEHKTAHCIDVGVIHQVHYLYVYTHLWL